MTDRLDSYKKMNGHPGYFQNSVSLKIRYIKVHNGRTVRISTGKTKITEAKKVVDEKLIEMFSSNVKKDKLALKGIKTPLIRDVWTEIIDDREATKHANTLEGYNVSWNYGIEPFWGDKVVTAFLDKDQWTEYKKWYLKTHPTRVFFNTGKHLGMIIRHSHESGYISKRYPVPDLDAVITAKTKKQDVGRVYTEAEYQACLESAFSLMVKTGIICYRNLGLRKMELLSALRKNWNLKKKIAKVWSDKNKAWREIYLPDVVVEALKLWIANCPESEYLFPASTNPGKHVASQVYDEQWRKTKIAAKVSDATVENAARTHDWRHTFATQTARDGWPPIVACYVLDMSLQEYQETYTHVSIEDIMKLMVKSFGSRK